ncbi:MAG: hypothetical protein AB1798_24475 [Spirochaetota bacterium]
MSLLSNALNPSACEVDVTGALAMYALQLASGSPSALLDWNNNFSDNPDKCILFHCSNLPKYFFKEMKMDFQEIIAGKVGKENSYGTCVGPIKAGDLTFARFTTDDRNGRLRSYIGEGRVTEDSLETFGGYGVAEILYEAFTRYLRIDTYYHK